MCGTDPSEIIISDGSGEGEDGLGSLGTCTYNGVGNWDRNLQG